MCKNDQPQWSPGATVVLAYHRISCRPLPAGTWVSPKQLAAHLDRLLAAGCRPVDAADWLRQQRADQCSDDPGPRNFLITFDDGTEDIYHHRDLLAARGVVGVVFVPAALIGRTNRWEWQLPGRRTRHLDLRHLRVLHSEGWEIGLHGATHQDLTRLSSTALAEELVKARRQLMQQLGAPVRLLSYPFGLVDARVAAVTAEAGFSAAFVLAQDHVDLPGRLTIRRRPIYCIDSAEDVLTKVIDPGGVTWRGRWEIRKEKAAHGIGRWFAARKHQPDASASGRK